MRMSNVIFLMAALMCGLSANAQSRELFVDFLGETAGANHSLGFIYLDIDTSGNGIPDFQLTGPTDDLDGDGITNDVDIDDDGDGIPDIDDKAGYDVSSGSSAGWAPSMGSTPAALFAHGTQAASAGLHPNDYWQFVPNGIYEQTGAPYTDGHGTSWPGIFLQAGAYLYVDRYDRVGNASSDGVPDALQSRYQSNTLPPYILEQDHESVSLLNQPTPGLLGSWSGGVSGAGLFRLCDDDSGTAVSTHFANHFPYRSGATLEQTDIYEGPDGQPDYDIYGTSDESSADIPASLKTDDAMGVRLWRYRSLAGPVADAREITYFLTVYWHSGGQQVNTWYSRAAFNESGGYFQRNRHTLGDAFGLDQGDVPVGFVTPDNWFPRFQNIWDHNMVAHAKFGLDWTDIADTPLNGDTPTAHDPANQDWVDRYQNYAYGSRIINYLDMNSQLSATPLDTAALIWSRYGIELTLENNTLMPRAEANRNAHFITWPVGGATGGYLMSWEDLYFGGDRSYCDTVFFTNRPPIIEP